MGRRTFKKLFHAVAKQTTQISCLSPPYMPNANAFKVLSELLSRLRKTMEEGHGPNEPTIDAWEEYLSLKTTPDQLSARLDALKEHLSSKTFCAHVCSLEPDTPPGSSSESCDGDAAHCARFATHIGCPKVHQYNCVPCAEIFLLAPLVWKIVQAVRNSLSRQFQDDQRFALIASAKTASEGWTLPLPSDPSSSQTRRGRRKKEVSPALTARIVHLLSSGFPRFKGVKMIMNAILAAWPSDEPPPTKNQISTVLHTVGVKEKRAGDKVQVWYVRETDGTPPPPPPPPPPPLLSRRRSKQQQQRRRPPCCRTALRVRWLRRHLTSCKRPRSAPSRSRTTSPTQSAG